MTLPDPVKYNEILWQLRNKIGARDYLTIEDCELCGMPFIKSCGMHQTSKRCEACREKVAEKRKWDKKVKGLRKRGLL